MFFRRSSPERRSTATVVDPWRRSTSLRRSGKSRRSLFRRREPAHRPRARRDVRVAIHTTPTPPSELWIRLRAGVPLSAGAPERVWAGGARDHRLPPASARCLRLPMARRSRTRPRAATHTTFPPSPADAYREYITRRRAAERDNAESVAQTGATPPARQVDSLACATSATPDHVRARRTTHKNTPAIRRYTSRSRRRRPLRRRLASPRSHTRVAARPCARVWVVRGRGRPGTCGDAVGRARTRSG